MTSDDEPIEGAAVGAGVDVDADVVAVACSGGRDSLSLLHAALAATPAGQGRVVALHVHHGLMPDADRWAADLEALCARWAAAGRPVAFRCTRLAGAPGAGESVEAWARRERYAALAAMARDAGATIVLLGHHRRDQAETVLLQALRGGGAAGLSAMPRIAIRDGLAWARPWLSQADEAITAYADAHGLPAARDPTNSDCRFARGRLRVAVMPALREAFPDAEVALVAVARHAQEARAVLDEVARDDLRALGAGEAGVDTPLALAAWRGLSEARRTNALRAWLADRLGRSAPDTLVRRLLDETPDDAPRRWPIDDARALRSWRGQLAVVRARVRVRDAGADADATGCEPGGDVPLSLLRCGAHAVPGWPGLLEVVAVAQGGVSPRRLAHVVARARRGGEQFQRRPGAAVRGLKKQFQAVGVAVDAREGPLLFDADGALLFVPALGIDARAWAGEGAPQWTLRWRALAADEG